MRNLVNFDFAQFSLLSKIYTLFTLHVGTGPNRATLYDQSSDTTEPCWKRPTYGWCAAVVQFSSVVAQFSCVHTVRDLKPGRPGSVPF